jgi:stage V sporulation protein B
VSADDDDVFQIAESSARGGYYLFVGNVLSTLILFVVSTLIARFLGPDDYGIYSLVLSVPSLFIGLIDFGITSATTRFAAEYKAAGRPSDVRRVIKSGIIFQLIVGLIVSAICFILSDFWATYLINTPEAGFYLRAVSLLVLFQALFNALSSAFVGLDKMENNAFIMTIRSIAKFFLSIPFVLFLGLGVVGAIFGHVLCYVVAVGVGLAFLLHTIPKDNETGNSLSILKSMLKYGAPIQGSSILGLFSTYYQIVLIAYFVSKAVVGNFQVITLFSTAMSVLLYPLSALFPAFSKLAPNNVQLGQFFKRSVKYTALFFIPASVSIIVMSKELVFTLFGSEYTLAPTFLAFNFLIYIYSGFGNVMFGYLFNGLGRTDVSLKRSLINLLVFIPSAPLLIWLYGIVGLITAGLISGFCTVVYCLLISIKKFNVSIDFGSSAKIFLSSFISALFCFSFLIFSPFSNVVNVFVGFSIFIFFYLTLLPVIGVINDIDLEIFRFLFYKTKTIWPIMKLLLAYEKKVMKFTKK